jgi:hypothetical protein
VGFIASVPKLPRARSGLSRQWGEPS